MGSGHRLALRPEKNRAVQLNPLNVGYVWNSVEINKNILCSDRVTRMLQETWSGHPRLNLALRLLCPVAGGARIVEDTVVAQLYAHLLNEAAWV